jgi:hypothetical protein
MMGVVREMGWVLGWGLLLNEYDFFYEEQYKEEESNIY